MDLDRLRQPFNPHLFFNALNHIYGLAIEEGAERTAASISDLSRVMRYLTYDVQKNATNISEEIALLRHYIKFQHNRFGDAVAVNITVPEALYESPFKIAPLLFLPLLENAYKHGVEQQGSGSIAIFIKQDEEGALIFNIENTKVEAQKAPEVHSGFGLRNLKERLDLVYGENYSLNITDQSSTYSVDLGLMKSL